MSSQHPHPLPQLIPTFLADNEEMPKKNKERNKLLQNTHDGHRISSRGVNVPSQHDTGYTLAGGTSSLFIYLTTKEITHQVKTGVSMNVASQQSGSVLSESPRHCFSFSNVHLVAGDTNWDYLYLCSGGWQMSPGWEHLSLMKTYCALSHTLPVREDTSGSGKGGICINLRLPDEDGWPRFLHCSGVGVDYWLEESCDGDGKAGR